MQPQSRQEFFGPGLDEPAYDGVRRYYLICSGPRVGSSLLCDLLRRSGVLGVPNEYFNLVAGAQFLAERLSLLVDGKVNIHAYASAIKSLRTTANGVFGAKLQYWNMTQIMQEQVISRHFPGAKFIYMTRQDVVAQGVSLAIAKLTRRYAKFRSVATDVTDRRGLVFDRQRVMEAINRVVSEDASWRRFFALADLDFMHVEYEPFLEDPSETCRRIAAYIGVETDYAFSLVDTHYVRERDELNAEWIGRIRDGFSY